MLFVDLRGFVWWHNSGMKRLLLPLLAALAWPIAGFIFLAPANSFWGKPSETMKKICRQRAAEEKNEFSAKQTYEYCIKNIQTELRDKERDKEKEQKIYETRYLNRYTVVAKSSKGNTRRGKALIPIVCLVNHKGEVGVLVVGENNDPQFKRIELGLTTGTKVEIINGIKPGDRVFIEIPNRERIIWE